MSSGQFNVGSYEANSGLFHPIQVQPETTQAVLAGSPNIFADNTVAGAVKSKISAKVSKGKDEIGLGPRKVSIKYGITDGSYPEDYLPGTVLIIPVFQKSLWDGLSKGDTATYLGVIGTLGDPIQESVK